MRAQNASTIALSNGAPTAPIDGARPASRTFWLKTHDANCTPLSLWMIASLPGLLRLMAIPSAFVTKSPVCELSINQPTTMGENASRTAQQ